MMRSRANSSEGFTLLEVLVSMVIFAIASAAMAQSFLTHLTMNNRSERRSEAIASAQQVLDQIRTEDPTSLPVSGSVAPVTVVMGPRTYTVTATYCGENTFCTSNNIRHIGIQVAYRNTVIYEVETVYSQLR